MANDEDDKPASSRVLKTAGEASASAHALAEVPREPECPTMEVDRVRIQAPSQTPTVRLADLAKRPGPRVPDQMTRPEPRGPVVLPEGRPVTESQVIEIDPDVLHDLVKRKVEADEQRRAEVRVQRAESPWVKEAQPVVVAELPSAEAPPPSSVAPAAKRPGREGALMIAAVLLAALVVAVAATRGPKARENALPSAATTTRATAAVPSAESASVPSAVPVRSAAVAPASAVPSAAPPPVIKPAGKPLRDAGDPYGAGVTPIPPKRADDPPPPSPTASPSVVPKPSASSWGGHAPEF